MKKKGFTLIELIAVVVILAIIALVAIPVITGIVNKSKKGAAEASAYNYIDAVEKYVMLHDLDSTKYPYELRNNTFNVSSNTEVSLLDIIIPKAKAEGTVPGLNSFISVKGDKPKSGTITLNEKGKVTEADLLIGKFSVECLNEKCIASTEKTSIVIDGADTTSVVVGNTIELKAITNSDKAITWTSSDDTIATVNNGVVAGKKVGNVTITAKIGKVSTSVTVNVLQVELQINGDKTRKVSMNSDITLEVTTNSSGTITWTSSDDTIATVNNGVVTGKKTGTATITASINNVSDTVTITVPGGATKDSSQIKSSANVVQKGVKGIVYFNPSNIYAVCNKSNSTVGSGTTGCMKWYIFKETTDKYYMILDHNTANNITWNSGSSPVVYSSSGAKTAINNLKWNSTLNTRLITVNEINEVTGKTGFNASSTASWYRLHDLSKNSNELGRGNSQFAWLFDYTKSCQNYGCSTQDNNSNLYYFTSDIVPGERIWLISYGGKLVTDYPNPGPASGIRPVIEVPKNLIG